MKHGTSADVEMKQGSLKRNTVAVERGNPWKRIPFALEKGTPLKRIPFEANPICFGEGDSLEVNLIHLEKGTPRIGGTPRRRIPFALEKGTPLKRIPFAVERGSPLR